MKAMPFDPATSMQTSTTSRRAAVMPLSCGLGLALMALTVTGFSSEAVVATGFERAFADLHKPLAGKPATALASRAFDGISGSEEFWLRSQADAMLVKAVAVGQHLTVSVNGTERRLIITGVTDADDGVTHIQTPGNRALLVTCREGEAMTGRVVRFRLDAGQIVELPDTATSQRAL
jgi:hypothetical protein